MKKTNFIFPLVLVFSFLVFTSNASAHGCQADTPTNAAGEKNEIEPNDDFGHATPLQPNVFYNGTGSKNNSARDFFEFHSQAKQIQLIVDVESATRDFEVLVYNKTREKIDYQKVLGGDLKQKIITVPAGRKFIQVYAYHDSSYKIKVRY